MTRDDQIEILAKLDGWTKLRLTIKGSGGQRNPSWHGFPPNKNYEASCNDYLGSRDAIIKVIEKQSSTIKIHVVIHLWRMSCIQHDDQWQTEDVAAILLSTPEQLCEALIRAVNKWKD